MKEKLTYEVIEQYANDHYNKIDDIKSLNEAEASSLLEDLNYLKISVNTRLVERLILKRKLSKILIFTILTVLTAQFLVTNSLILIVIFLINVIEMIKNIREYKPLENELENKYTNDAIRITTIISNCERMINKKLNKEENLDKENNSSLDLEGYANYVIDYYLKNGTVMKFLNPKFDIQVKMTLLIILKDNYGIDISKGIKKSLETFKNMEANGPKLTKKR